MYIGYMQILCHFTQKHRWILVSEGVLEPLLLGYQRMTLSDLQTKCANINRRALIQEQQFKQPCLCYECTCAYTCSHARTHKPHSFARVHSTHTHYSFVYVHTHTPHSFAYTPHSFARTNAHAHIHRHTHHSFVHAHTPFFCTHTHTPFFCAYTSFLCMLTNTPHSFEQIPYRSHLCNFLLLPFICWDVFELTRIL